MMKRILSYIVVTMVLTLCFSVSSFGAIAIYQKVEERYPQGEFMIIINSPGYGFYALGIEGNQWILRQLPDISVVENEDSRFLFTFEERESDERWMGEGKERQWEVNHAMALHHSSGYLDFAATRDEFLYATPLIVDEPAYHWQYKVTEKEKGYLKYKGAFETAGLAGSLWARADAEKTVIQMRTVGKGSDVWLYQEVEGATKPEISGGWQDYRSSTGRPSWKYVNADGTLKRNEWYLENGKWYYLGNDGVALLGFQQLPDGNFYYFHADASLVISSEISVNRIPYRIDENGVCHRVSEQDASQTVIRFPQSEKDDELLNWINLKRVELGLAPLYRDNRLSQIAYDVANQTDGILGWEQINEMGREKGISFTKRGNLRMNWNNDFPGMSLDAYFQNASFGELVSDPEWNHIGVYSELIPYTSTRDCILVVGTY